MVGLKAVLVLGCCVLSHGQMVDMCMAKTSADVLLEYRTALGCPNAAPTDCPISGHNEPNITCDSAQKALWQATWTGAAATCIKVTPDVKSDWSKHDFHYPSNYANTCDQSGMEPGSYDCTKVTCQAHSFASGAGYNAAWNTEAWCLTKFRWVDPCTCNKLDMKKSSWLNSYYSYSACGAEDIYTAASCDATAEAACIGSAQCKWGPGSTTTTTTVGRCVAKTSADVLVEYRTALGCPTAAPTSCSCAANSEPTVTCDAAQKALWSANWTGAAATCIKVTPDVKSDWSKHDFHYPSSYANTCDQSGMEPGSYDCTKVTCQTHSFASGPGYNSAWNTEAWCLTKFCWVDPCTCNKLDMKKSSWLNSYYSYSACGAEDIYTPASCDATTQATCISSAQCKWTAGAPSSTTGSNTTVSDGASKVQAGLMSTVMFVGLALMK